MTYSRSLALLGAFSSLEVNIEVGTTFHTFFKLSGRDELPVCASTRGTLLFGYCDRYVMAIKAFVGFRGQVSALVEHFFDINVTKFQR